MKKTIATRDDEIIVKIEFRLFNLLSIDPLLLLIFFHNLQFISHLTLFNLIILSLMSSGCCMYFLSQFFLIAFK